MCCLQLVHKLANNGCCRNLRPNSNSSLEGIIPKRAESFKKCSTPEIDTEPCRSYVKKREKPMDTSPQYTFLMKSMWERAPCCVTCVKKVAPLRHDLLYLKEEDYRERRYQRTWPQCPPRCLVPKKCFFEKLDVPEMEKRPRGKQNPDAKMCVTLHPCATVDKYATPCTMTCKQKGRCVFSEPSCCQKRCTMYPSYSECCAKALVQKRPTECGCLYPGGLCEINAWARRMGLIKIED